MTTYLIVFFPAPYPQPSFPPMFSHSFYLSRKLGQGERIMDESLLSHCPAGSAVCPLAHRVLHYSDVQLDVCLVHICWFCRPLSFSGGGKEDLSLHGGARRQPQHLSFRCDKKLGVYQECGWTVFLLFINKECWLGKTTLGARGYWALAIWKGLWTGKKKKKRYSGF